MYGFGISTQRRVEIAEGKKTHLSTCLSQTRQFETTAGTLTVYYEVSADNYALLTGSATVTVAKADIATGSYTAPETVVVTGDGKKAIVR